MSNRSAMPGEATSASSVVELCTKKTFWRALVDKDIVYRALAVAAVVGTILVLINQADVFIAGDVPPLWKIVLTYCVPYSVSSYSAAAFKVSAAED